MNRLGLFDPEARPRRRNRLTMGGPLLFGPFAGLDGHGYQCVYADVPWTHATRTPNGQTRRSPSHHYPTMSLAEIRSLPVADIAARDCHLFFWTTAPHLEQAFSVIKAWGFTYSSIAFTWVKLRKRYANAEGWIKPGDVHRATAYTTWKSTEIVLLGRRGSPVRVATNVNEVLFAPRREHSRKPDQVAERIEAYCHGPRLELFARERREGWESWGHEVDKFGAAGDAP